MFRRSTAMRRALLTLTLAYSLACVISIPALAISQDEDASCANEPKKRPCQAGTCLAWNKIYSCGMIMCPESETECGCDCISVNGGAFYPKGYCGSNTPYASKNWRYYQEKHEKEKTPNLLDKPSVFSLH